MKRIVLWMMSTLGALIIVFDYKTSTSSALDTANSAALKSVTLASTPSTTNTPKSSTGGVATTKTVTGAVVQTMWGPVQVQLTVAGGKITAVSVLQHPTGGNSDEVNAQALPILVSETMKSQSAGIDMVSGATYTSTGYLKSLQSALDQAGF